jgi:hypothetical protein
VIVFAAAEKDIFLSVSPAYPLISTYPVVKLLRFSPFSPFSELSSSSFLHDNIATLNKTMLKKANKLNFFILNIPSKSALFGLA